MQPDLSISCSKSIRLEWKSYTSETLDDALKESFCLYVFHHPQDGDRPFYIGKAKHFGTKQSSGYKGAARYNSGYVHLIAGLLRSGFTLYVANIGAEAFASAESYEQELIEKWKPVRKQRIKKNRRPVKSKKPWCNHSQQ